MLYHAPKTQSEEEHGRTEMKKKATVEDVAVFIQVPLSWVYDRTRRGAIPCLRVGKYVRFDIEEIDRWAKAGCPVEWAE